LCACRPRRGLLLQGALGFTITVFSSGVPPIHLLLSLLVPQLLSLVLKILLMQSLLALEFG